MGPRFQARLRQTERHTRALPQRSRNGPDGYSRRADARRHCPSARPARSASLHNLVRPPQHIPVGRTQPRKRCPPSPDSGPAARISRRLRNNLLPIARLHGEDRSGTAEARLPRRTLPRRNDARRPQPRPETVHSRRASGRGRYGGLRNGHRQEQYPVGCPQQPSVEHRELLSGGRPRRTRRAAGQGTDVLLVGRRRHAAQARPGKRTCRS